MSAPRSSVEVELRKLRKKLRQTENLEKIDRALNDEELDKVFRKDEIRERIQILLQQIPSSSPANEGSAIYSSKNKTDEARIEEVHIEEQEYEPSSNFSLTVQEEANFEEDRSYTIHPADDQPETPETDMKRAASSHTNPSGDHDMSDLQQAQHEATSCPTPEKKKREDKKEKSTDWKVSGKPEVSEQYKEVVNYWRRCQFEVTFLTGHNDIVLDVKADSDIMVSASRDTMVKIWDLETGAEMKSLGGHTESVTSVILLTKEESEKLISGGSLGTAYDDKLIISGSQDCSFKLWSLKTGKQLKSVYTYNPIRCLSLIKRENSSLILVTGSGGGKVELWDLTTGDNIHSVRAHEEAITDLQVSQGFLYTSSTDGLIKVYELRDTTLHPMFVSEDVKLTSGSPCPQRSIHSMGVSNSKVYYGDDGVNLKVMDWKQGLVRKLCNHTCEVGATDAVCVSNNLVMSASYDLDTGNGSVNVRYAPNQRYVGTLDDEDGRVLCLCCTKTKQNHTVFITGGQELRMWHLHDKNGDDDEMVAPCFYTSLDRPARHSDVESDEDQTEESSESEGEVWAEQEEEAEAGNTDLENSKGWMSWCSVL